jgi:cold shock protein
MTAERINGTVRLWIDSRGFGFVSDDHGNDHFAHIREMIKSGIPLPKPGLRVSFIPESGPKGLRATNVTTA